jgi:hypothetical protein
MAVFPFPICLFLFTFARRPWLIVAVFLFLAAPVPAHTETIDHIVAAVNNEVITASEHKLAGALNTRVGGGTGNARVRNPRRPDQQAFTHTRGAQA